MGERRMFSGKVIITDDFLELPATARCLYFTLNMFADDDGFLDNYKTVMRICNAAQNDFDILKMKSYVIDFNNGVIVIRHWKVHNLIQADRYKATAYVDEKEMLSLDNKKAYVLINAACEALPKTQAEPAENTVYTECIQDVYTSKDKTSKDKASKFNNNTVQADAFNQFWNAYPAGHKTGKQYCEKALAKVLKTGVTIETLLQALEEQKRSKQWTKDGGQYIPNPATWLNQGRWEDELEQQSIYKRRDIDVEELPEVRRPNKT